MIRIDAQTTIPESELRFTFSPSSGPGGQNVNKVATRATLLFQVAESPSLDESSRGRILEKLAARINSEGVLRIVCDEHRTREANRRAALERFGELLRGAVRRPKPRRPTRPTRASRQRRVEAKRARSSIKQGRRGRAGEE